VLEEPPPDDDPPPEDEPPLDDDPPPDDEPPDWSDPAPGAAVVDVVVGAVLEVVVVVSSESDPQPASTVTRASPVTAPMRTSRRGVVIVRAPRWSARSIRAP
jgi:hypothetical protein